MVVCVINLIRLLFHNSWFQNVLCVTGLANKIMLCCVYGYFQLPEFSFSQISSFHNSSWPDSLSSRTSIFPNLLLFVLSFFCSFSESAKTLGKSKCLLRCWFVFCLNLFFAVRNLGRILDNGNSKILANWPIRIQ